MNKSVFLTIIYILFVRMWSFSALSSISNDIFTIIILLLLVLSCIIYRPYKNLKFGEENKKYLYWIIVGWVGSMFMAYIFHGQSFLQSILTYKTQYLMLSILFIMKIAPSENDIIKSLKYYTIIFSIVYIIRYISPSLFEHPATSDYYVDEVSIPGYELICILLYFYMEKLINKFDTRTFIYSILIIVLIFFQQNRSSLFPVVILSGWTMLHIKSKYKPIILTCVSLIVVYAIIQTSEIWAELIDQTQDEMSNSDYNRNKALIYFVMQASPSIWCDILGNGFLSAHTSSQMAQLMKEGIYNSDMGFIGYWNQFGIIPVIVFCHIFISSIFSKKIPYYLKLFAIQSLICAVTTSYYGESAKIICFVVFYYLYEYNLKTFKIKQRHLKSNNAPLNCPSTNKSLSFNV